MHILTNASIFLVEVSQMCQTGDVFLLNALTTKKTTRRNYSENATGKNNSTSKNILNMSHSLDVIFTIFCSVTFNIRTSIG
jgi:hypothetical protein